MQNELVSQEVLCVSHDKKGETQRHVTHFLDAQLRSAAGFSIIQEYPSLFGDFPGGESLIVRVHNKIASHVGYVSRDFHHPAYRMKVGLLGSVATAPEFRKQGLASRLVIQASQELKKKGCAVALLWSADTGFYLPLGFHRMGRETDFRFSRKLAPTELAAPIPFDAKKHASAVWRLYQKHELKVDRSLEEQRKLCSIPRCRIFVTEKNDVVTSYIVVNKGADFEGYVHEWGGPPDEVVRNLLSVQHHVFPSKELTLIAPSHYDLTDFRKSATMEWDGVVGLMRVLDRNRLMDLYVQYLKGRAIPFHWDRDQQAFTIEDHVFPLERDLDYLRLIFGEGEMSLSPKLPFFLWGFDSI